MLFVMKACNLGCLTVRSRVNNIESVQGTSTPRRHVKTSRRGGQTYELKRSAENRVRHDQTRIRRERRRRVRSRRKEEEEEQL